MGLANHTMLISKNGESFQIADSAAPIRNESGEVDGVVLVFRDVTGEYEKERRLHTLMKNLPGMAYRCKNDRRWTMEFVSDGCHDLTGYAKEELEENRSAAYGDLIVPADNERVWQDVQEALTGHRYFTVRYRIRTKEGEEKWVWEQGVGIHSTNGNLLHIEGFITDISSEMQARGELEKALGEKDALMRELTHRVKNNLSMVSSLIRLKNAEIDDDLSDLIHRIDTVRLVHEKLHRADTADRIEMKDYIQDVLDTLFSSFSKYRVDVVNSIDDMQLQPQRAVPIGLIVNELATNAIQHGFNEEEDARFSVHMETDEDSIILIVSNTGNPLPDTVDFDNPHSLGLQLISTLVQQLGGTLTAERTPHTRFIIRFPADT
jgi:PAS domain S-box-containing protein